jgi:hypothetical protein
MAYDDPNDYPTSANMMRQSFASDFYDSSIQQPARARRTTERQKHRSEESRSR